MRIIKSEHDGRYVKLDFDEVIRDGTYHVSGGICFPKPQPFLKSPLGACVVLGEKDGVYIVLKEFVFSEKPDILLNETYDLTKCRRFFFNSNGRDRMKLQVCRNPQIKWKPVFLKSPVTKVEDGLHDVYGLLSEGKLKYAKDSLIYQSLRNNQKDAITEALCWAVAGILKFRRRG